MNSQTARRTNRYRSGIRSRLWKRQLIISLITVQRGILWMRLWTRCAPFRMPCLHNTDNGCTCVRNQWRFSIEWSRCYLVNCNWLHYELCLRYSLPTFSRMLRRFVSRPLTASRSYENLRFFAEFLKGSRRFYEIIEKVFRETENLRRNVR